MGFSRQEYQSGLPFSSPGYLPDPEIEPGSLHCRQTLYSLIHQGSWWKVLPRVIVNNTNPWALEPTTTKRGLTVSAYVTYRWFSPSESPDLLLLLHFLPREGTHSIKCHGLNKSLSYCNTKWPVYSSNLRLISPQSLLTLTLKNHECPPLLSHSILLIEVLFISSLRKYKSP